MGLLKLQECQDRGLVKDREGRRRWRRGIKTRGGSLEKGALLQGFAWHSQEVKAPTVEHPRVLWAFLLGFQKEATLMPLCRV